MSMAPERPRPSPETQRLIDAEAALFAKEYEKYFVAGVSKPQEIGMPFFMHSPESDTGVLLIHGLMAAPEEVRQWAEFLRAGGLTVYAPRLAGHGTSPDDLAARSYRDWLDSIDRGHAILKTCCKKILIAGFSTGAGLALQTVILKPRDFEAVIAVSAPLQFQSFSSRFAELLHSFNLLCGHLDRPSWTREFVRNHADNPHINYLQCPVSAFVQVKALMRKVRRSLPEIRIPSLVLHARHDPKVAPRSGPAIFRRLDTDQKHFVWIDFNQHGIVRGEIARKVFQEVELFLTEHRLIQTEK